MMVPSAFKGRTGLIQDGCMHTLKWDLYTYCYLVKQIIYKTRHKTCTKVIIYKIGENLYVSRDKTEVTDLFQSYELFFRTQLSFSEPQCFYVIAVNAEALLPCF